MRSEKQLEITWKWFEFHANQRLIAFYYFLLITGALAFGYMQCLSNNNSQLALILPFISILSIFVSIAFLLLEVRNVELVNIGRESLRRLEFSPAVIDYADHEADKNENKNTKIKALKLAMGIKDKEKKLPFLLGLIVRERLVKHEFWLRFIYLNVFFVSVISLIYAILIIWPRIWSWLYWFLIFAIIMFIYLAFIVCYLSFNNRWKRVSIISTDDC